jgi:hypothetical protein
MQEGVKALYKGWVPSVIGVVPYVGLNFAVYGTMKDVMIAQYGAMLALFNRFAAAPCTRCHIAAGGASCMLFLFFLVFPLTTLSGSTSTGVPAETCYTLTGVKSERDLSVITKLGCGAVAGTIGQTVAYPFDVARRRLQVGSLLLIWVACLGISKGGCLA